MSTTIRRGGKGVRKAAAARSKAQAVRGAKARTDGVLARLPISQAVLQRLFMAGLIVLVCGATWGVARFVGLPDLVRARIADASSTAGFVVRRIEVRGVKQMDEQKIYERAIAAQELPMTLLDVDALRDELIGLSWVKDARVSRQLPDTLIIDIVERRAHAVLRQGENFVLIDPSGHRLEPVPRAKAEKMLVLSGEGAAQRAGNLSELIDAAPALKPRVRGAEWIGHRRWNLTFDTGQVLALPEGEPQAAEALQAFAQLDGMNRLLGGQVAVFDMRADDRVYMRVPGRAAEQAKLEAERRRLAAEAARRAEAGDEGEGG